MAYTHENFPTKKALKLAANEFGRDRVTVYQPGPFGPEVEDGAAVIEGPHYPEPHRWYAQVEVEDGAIVPGSVR